MNQDAYAKLQDDIVISQEVGSIILDTNLISQD